MRGRKLVALAIAAAAALLAVSLGNWQLRRADHKLALQASWDRAERMDPLTVTAAAAAAIGRELPRPVQMRGRFLFEYEVWLDNRQMDGKTGLLLITPLRLDDGAVVLVNRGFVQRDPRDRTRLPKVERPAGEMPVAGLAVDQPSRVLQIGANAPEGGRLPAIWQNFDFDAFERASGLQAPHWIVQQTSNADDGLMRDWPRRDAGVQMHRGYAAQWYSLAALIVVLTIFLGFRGPRRDAAASAREDR